MAHSFPEVPLSINTSQFDIYTSLYEPCLLWAKHYDRGVGYFTSGWISQTSKGMADFVARGGKARWIASPIIQKNDFEIIKTSPSDEVIDYFRNLLLGEVDKLANEMEENTLNAFAWMLFDGVIEMRFAVPNSKLEGGDFHDKFGIFYYGEHALSFAGSINDSIKGFVNYESIKVFQTWNGTESYVRSDIDRFELLWLGNDPNVHVFSLGKAVKQKIFSIRKKDRPYKLPGDKGADRWKHQTEAMNAFLTNSNGILEMATGTGKTRTAINIIKELYNQKKIKRVIITTHGNDLLSQWVKELYKLLPEIPVFQFYENKKQFTTFLLNKQAQGILVVSRDATRLRQCLNKLEQIISSPYQESLLIFDEVHGMGSVALRESLTGRFKKYKYRLGLSATPNRMYDEKGNDFIEEEVGPVIFRFTLEDAIKRGILCEFDYLPSVYELTEDEKQKKRDIIARYSFLAKEGKAGPPEDLYRDLARVNKTSVTKIPLFDNIIRSNPAVLERCIIFTETKEYGELVQQCIIKYIGDFHTYYGDDDATNLKRFADGHLRCLVTCKKISEGIDIQSVNSIVLFSSDKSNLETTQRIGRSLRTDPNNPTKKATIIDFILENSDENDDELSTDEERCSWLTSLSNTKRCSP